MGSKFKAVLKEQRKCKCGKGNVFYHDNEWDLEYPPFEEITKGDTTTNCPDNCEDLKKI